MIPLRILQVVADHGGFEAVAAEALAGALQAQGQRTGLLLAGSTSADPGASAETDVLRWKPGWWRWWRGGRRDLGRRVAAWMPDVLHLHGISVLGPVLDLARDLRLPLVVQLSGAVDPLLARRLHDPAVDCILTATEHHRALAIGRLGLPRDRIAILPPAAFPAPPRPAPAEPSPLASDGPRIGAVAWGPDPLGEGGLRRFLRVVATLQGSALPMAAAVLVDQDQATRVAAAAKDLGAEVAVIPSRALRPFLGSIEILALPSAREPHPVLPLTAMACGLPLVAMAVGAVPELVRDGQTALLVSGDQDDALEDALRSLHNRTRRESLGQAGASLAAERYAPDLVARAADAIHRDAIGGDGETASAEATRAWRRMTAHQRRR